MTFHFLSQTKAGKWATGLTLVFVVLMAIKMTGLGMDIRLPLPSPLLAVIGMVGFIMGLIAFIKYKDRAVLTILSLVIGLLLTIWTTAEIFFPH